MYYVYILRSRRDQLLYTGYTANLKKRYWLHRNGHVKATRNRLPLDLVFCLPFYTRKETEHMEWFLKNTGSGRILKKKLAKIFNQEDFIKYLAWLKYYKPELRRKYYTGPYGPP